MIEKMELEIGKVLELVIDALEEAHEGRAIDVLREYFGKRLIPERGLGTLFG